MADQAHTPDAGDAAALQTAERVLATAFAGRPRLELLTPLAAATWRNRVLRCRVLDAEPGVPDTVVLKQPRAGYDPGRAAWPTLSLLNEWAGLQFLGSLGLAPPLAPRLYGGDRAAGLVVLEDLTMLAEPAPAGPLDAELAELQIMPGSADNVFFALLRRDRARAERLLVQHAAALGRMHAASAGREAEYRRLRAALGPDGPSPARSPERALPQLRDDLARLGIVPDPAFDREVAAILAALDAPGPFLAYTHGDPCPGNDVVVGEQVRLLDFELGGFGHALRDAVHPHVLFPTNGCAGAVPDSVIVAMEAGYRRELVGGIPLAADDRLFDRAVVQMCAYWALRTLAGGYGQAALGQALIEDARWGWVTMRARIVTRLHRYLTIARTRGEPDALTATLARLADHLARLWPDVGTIPLYPAFA